MDPIQAINPKKDSSLAMLLAAQKKGWSIDYLEQRHLSKDGGEVYANAAPLKVYDSLDHWFDLGEHRMVSLRDFDVILMRKDPPFDDQFLFTTHLLDFAKANGVLVVNNPQALRDCNEKIFATHFPELCPPVIISAEADRLKAFHAEHKDIILKPLDGMGGASIFRAQPQEPNLSVIIETLSDHGRKLVMAQRYLPEIVDGDKRILLINGEPIAYGLARIPSSGETRGNLAAGGTGVAKALTERERTICATIKDNLVSRGLLFVGIDVIGGYLTEINVTSPTCIRELDHQCNLDIGSQLMDAIEMKRNN
jgi:glutathione synthase